MTKCETGMHWRQVEARWEVQTDQKIKKKTDGLIKTAFKTEKNKV